MKYTVNRNFVLGCIAAKNLKIKDVCKALNCSRVYFYVATTREYTAPRSLFINKVVDLLDLEKELVWQVEE